MADGSNIKAGALVAGLALTGLAVPAKTGPSTAGQILSARGDAADAFAARYLNNPGTAVNEEFHFPISWLTPAEELAVRVGLEAIIERKRGI